MPTLLLDPDVEDQALQATPRQIRREDIRRKAIDSKRRREALRQSQLPPGTESRRDRRRREKEEARCESFVDHCYIVANMIMRLGRMIEQFEEERQWFTGENHLIENLAAQWNVVTKHRPALSPVTDYERAVITAALTICKLDDVIRIEEKLGWLRMHVRDCMEYPMRNADRLRVA